MNIGVSWLECVGDWGVGDWNVGDWNVGEWNVWWLECVGDWNVGDCNVWWLQCRWLAVLVIGMLVIGCVGDWMRWLDWVLLVMQLLLNQWHSVNLVSLIHINNPRLRLVLFMSVEHLDWCLLVDWMCWWLDAGDWLCWWIGCVDWNVLRELQRRHCSLMMEQCFAKWKWFNVSHSRNTIGFEMVIGSMTLGKPRVIDWYKWSSATPRIICWCCYSARKQSDQVCITTQTKNAWI